jgi:hypothetical protein
MFQTRKMPQMPCWNLQSILSNEQQGDTVPPLPLSSRSGLAFLPLSRTILTSRSLPSDDLNDLHIPPLSDRCKQNASLFIAPFAVTAQLRPIRASNKCDIKRFKTGKDLSGTDRHPWPDAEPVARNRNRGPLTQAHRSALKMRSALRLDVLTQIRRVPGTSCERLGPPSTTALAIVSAALPQNNHGEVQSSVDMRISGRAAVNIAGPVIVIPTPTTPPTVAPSAPTFPPLSSNGIIFEPARTHTTADAGVALASAAAAAAATRAQRPFVPPPRRVPTKCSFLQVRGGGLSARALTAGTESAEKQFVRRGGDGDEDCGRRSVPRQRERWSGLSRSGLSRDRDSDGEARHGPETDKAPRPRPSLRLSPVRRGPPCRSAPSRAPAPPAPRRRRRSSPGGPAPTAPPATAPSTSPPPPPPPPPPRAGGSWTASSRRRRCGSGPLAGWTRIMDPDNDSDKGLG